MSYIIYELVYNRKFKRSVFNTKNIEIFTKFERHIHFDNVRKFQFWTSFGGIFAKNILQRQKQEITL